MAHATPITAARTSASVLERPLPETRWGCATLAVLLCLGIGLRLENLSDTIGRSPDESVYTRQANVVREQGTWGLRRLTAEYNSDASQRLFPPPTRAAYLWLLVAAMRLSGRSDVSASAYVSCAASIGSLFVLALIGIRFFPPLATVFGLLFLAVSPAELELARRTWGDALAGFLGLALVYAAAELSQVPNNSRRRLWCVAFATLGALESLAKESGAVVFGLCGMWILWVFLFQRRDWKAAVAVLAEAAICFSAGMLWLAYSLGGLGILSQTFLNFFHANSLNSYALEYQSGPPYLLLQALWIVSPAPAVLAVVGVGVVLLGLLRSNPLRLSEDTAQWAAPAGMSFFTLSFLAIPMVLPHWLNLRYISVMFGPFYLLAGLGFWYGVRLGWTLLNGWTRQAFAAFVLVAVIAGAAANYRRFHTMLVRDALGDLSVKLLLDSAHLAAAEARVKHAPTAENYFSLCKQYDQQSRYKDALAACGHDLQKQPNSAEAYSEMAAAYSGLEMWDAAIAAAQRALQAQPNSATALTTLEHARRQKAPAAVSSAGSP